MNLTFSQRIVDEAMVKDPADASAEYLAMFRSDLENFVDRDLVD